MVRISFALDDQWPHACSRKYHEEFHLPNNLNATRRGACLFSEMVLHDKEACIKSLPRFMTRDTNECIANNLTPPKRVSKLLVQTIIKLCA